MAGVYGITTDLVKKRLGEDRVIQITDDANSGAVVEAHVDEAVLSAEAELHLYAGVYYDVPLVTSGATTPTGVKELLTDSVCWRLMTRRPEFLRGSDDEGRFWEARREEILHWLRAIAHAVPERRLLIPGAVEGSTGTQSRGGAPKVTSDEPRFSVESLKGFLS